MFLNQEKKTCLGIGVHASLRYRNEIAMAINLHDRLLLQNLYGKHEKVQS
jgi:hypothetical protein